MCSNTPHLLSPIGHSFQFFRVPGALNCDLCGGSVEFPEIVRGEFDGNRSDVLFQPFQFRGAGNGNNPGFLCQEPGERDLSGCRTLLRGKGSNQVHQPAICLACFSREAGETAAIILLIKLRAFRDRPREESLAKRTERNEAPRCRQKSIDRSFHPSAASAAEHRFLFLPVQEE
jgi:hypothetical protein